MDSRDLTPEQAEKLLERLRGQRVAMVAIQERMKVLAWYSVDPVYQSITAAIAAITAAALSVELQRKLPATVHYDSSKATFRDNPVGAGR